MSARDQQYANLRRDAEALTAPTLDLIKSVLDKHHRALLAELHARYSAKLQRIQSLEAALTEVAEWPANEYGWREVAQRALGADDNPEG